MGELIRFENVSITLNNKLLYNNLNLELKKSDKYVFLGPNGIGKSLLMELLSLGYSNDLACRYRGLHINGKIIDDAGNDLLDPDTKRRIAYVSQNEDFYRGMTVKEICENACHGIGIELNEEKLDSLLDSFGISDKKNLKIKNNLSYGEGKIVHIISRILKLPAADLLLLDEPLNHLSFRNSKIFNDIIKTEIQEKTDLAVLMISHCRAMDFANNAWVYNNEKNNIIIKKYSAYDCFSNDEYNDCF